jgi:hypothetical protein
MESAPLTVQCMPDCLSGWPMTAAMRVLQVDIVVPVRNEERDLAPSVRRLVSYLREGFPFTARVTIADNGSTDLGNSRPIGP